MDYMVLIYGDEAGYQQMTKAESDAMFTAFMEYNRTLAEAGVLKGGGNLQPSHTATTLRGAHGDIKVTDGPFAEAREQLGGYYILNCADEAAALAWARQCPVVHAGGSIEVRAIQFMPEEVR
jgi:hypothetical protein